MTTIALTGGTGFVGGKLIELALEQSVTVRALTRRDQAAREGVVWVPGSLDDIVSLTELIRGADAVIHVAGVVNAPTREGFAKGNIEGVANMIAAAKAAGVTRFVHVSSLASREPQLSTYGWSKAEGDKLVRASALDWTIVRPPAIYGPGDYEMLELFKLAAKGLALTPPGGRMSAIEVSDLGRLLLALAGAEGMGGMTFDADDGRTGGWSHGEFAQAVGVAVGKKVRVIALPRAIMMLAARGDRLFRGAKAKLTPDRVDYFCHENWVIDADKRPPAQLWQPQVATPAGLAATAAWYRANGLL
ncbi:MAG: epimerase [Sphingomonas sp.]|nr:epimerase [Sphingomonas sp.]